MHITFYPTRLFQRHHPPPSSFLPIRQSGDRTRRTFPSTSHPVRIFPKRFYEKLNIIAPHKNELTRLLLFEHLSHDNFSISIVDGYCESWPPQPQQRLLQMENISCKCRNKSERCGVMPCGKAWDANGYCVRRRRGVRENAGRGNQLPEEEKSSPNISTCVWFRPPRNREWAIRISVCFVAQI